MAAGWICVRDVYYKQQSAEAVIIVIIIFNGPPSSSLHSAFSNVFNPQKYMCVCVELILACVSSFCVVRVFSAVVVP